MATAARQAVAFLVAVAALGGMANAQGITITTATGSGTGEVDLFYSTTIQGIASVAVSVSGAELTNLETHNVLTVGGKVTMAAFSMFDLTATGLPLSATPSPLVTMTFAGATPGVTEVCLEAVTAFAFSAGFFPATIPSMMQCAIVGGTAPTMTGSGSALSDPHMHGLRGQEFDFTGEASKIYALVSDQAMEINALFDTAWVGSTKLDSDTLITEPMTEKGTWIREIGVLLGVNQILVSVDTALPSFVCPKSAKQESDSSCFRGGSVSVNGESMIRVGEVVVDASLSIVLKNFKTFGRVSIISDDLKLDVDNVPPPSHWELPDEVTEDYSHLNMHITAIQLTADADGVLGQTSRVVSDASGNLITSSHDSNGLGVLANSPEDFEVSEIFATDSHVNKYSL